jgi:N-methylhydantoinase A
VEALDEAEVISLASTLKAAGVTATAVSFLNAYTNPAHEDRTVEILRKCLPDVFITSGTALTREWFEYERSATAAANAYVGPAIAAYTAGFTKRFREKGRERWQ